MYEAFWFYFVRQYYTDGYTILSLSSFSFFLSFFHSFCILLIILIYIDYIIYYIDHEMINEIWRQSRKFIVYLH